MPSAKSSWPTSGFPSSRARDFHTQCSCVSSAGQPCPGGSHGPLASICGTVWGKFHTFPPRTPSRIEPCCSQSNGLQNAPFIASCLLCLTSPPCFLRSSSQTPCSQHLSQSLLWGNSTGGKCLPPGICAHQSRKIKQPFRVLIQKRGSKTRGRLAFHHTLFTSKFSCTGGVGHFPRWNACPWAAPKRPASAESSNSAVTILGLGGWRRDLELEETKQLEASEQPLGRGFWAGRSGGQSSPSACRSLPSSSRATWTWALCEALLPCDLSATLVPPLEHAQLCWIYFAATPCPPVTYLGIFQGWTLCLILLGLIHRTWQCQAQ